ncbi:hypothetical protein NBRC10512_004367 [Rhodotorula toruloides]|uniref:RHTO0S15e04456g1_1 n=2 Tax=Rhodotorula toruloides TaxID=5286 RepID=A0A061BDE7_RHOTO|nr:transcription factor TFIIB [Rhodotorula toruloides NP11]EMS25380.1 transcription factor TFIIB [Rhodotorula toruloides NP11]CDR47975.1 RHTO0S15e04456g1_1 [Rhodotorula toruloides]
MSGYCASCHTSNSLEYSPETGVLACTVCGTVSSSSASQSFEFLARVDEEDEFQNGRTYIGSGALAGEFGGVGAMQVRRQGGKSGAWARAAGEGAKNTHDKKQTDATKYIRRILNRFELYNTLHMRVEYFFRLAKEKVKFRWGRRAEIFAAACVYAAAVEAGKDLSLFDLMDAIDAQDIFALTRAIRILKLELHLSFEENDPAMYIEVILAYLKNTFSTSATPAVGTSAAAGKVPLHSQHNPTKKFFSDNNVKWLRGISLPAVRALATGVLEFTKEAAFLRGRQPNIVAAAVIFVALEGTARRIMPIVQEFADELGWSLGVRPITIVERYREINKALAEYAPQLPWLAGEEFLTPEEIEALRGRKKAQGRKALKKELVAYTSDIVDWRKAIDAKRAAERREQEAKEAKERMESPGEEAYHSEGTPDPGGGANDEDGDNEREADAGNDAAYFLDPVLHPDTAAAAALYFRDPSAPPDALARDASVKPQKDQKPKKPSPPAPPAAVDARPPGMKRPREPVTVKRPTKRQKAIAAAAESLASGGSSSTSAGKSASTSAFVPHDPQHVQIRQLLLAGHAPEAIDAHFGAKPDEYSKQISTPFGPSTRLQRLLWRKRAEDIVEDDELFDPDELDLYIRTQADVDELLKHPDIKQMLIDAEEVERLQEGRRPRKKRPRKLRTRIFPTLHLTMPVSGVPEAEAKVAGWTPGATYGDDPVDDAAGAGAGASGTTGRRRTGAAGTFPARPRKTKVTAELKAKFDAYLAMDDEDEGGAGGADAWLDLAVDAARDEGEDVASDDEEEDEEANEGRDEGEEGAEDWRKELGYGVDGVEDEEE